MQIIIVMARIIRYTKKYQERTDGESCIGGFRAGILWKEALMAWKKGIPRTVGIGIQDFAKMVTNNCFYVDKTDFIREW